MPTRRRPTHGGRGRKAAVRERQGQPGREGRHGLAGRTGDTGCWTASVSCVVVAGRGCDDLLPRQDTHPNRLLPFLRQFFTRKTIAGCLSSRNWRHGPSPARRRTPTGGPWPRGSGCPPPPDRRACPQGVTVTQAQNHQTTPPEEQRHRPAVPDGFPWPAHSPAARRGSGLWVRASRVCQARVRLPRTAGTSAVPRKTRADTAARG